MKILIHTDEYNPTAQACSFRMEVFAKNFLECGDDVTVITSSANKANGPIHSHKETILYSPAILMKKKTTFMRLLNNVSFGITSVFTAMRAGEFDVVLTTSPPVFSSIPGWMIARMKHAKLIYDVRDIWPDVALEMGSFSDDSIYCKVFSFITRFMYRHADMISTVSPRKVEKLRRYAIDSTKQSEAAQKVTFVGNGFDEMMLDQQTDDSVVRKYGLLDRFTCVYIGNIGLAQGLGTLLDVASKTKHRGVQFLIFGKGAEEEMLKKRAEKEALPNVHFCGVLPHNEIASVLRNAKFSYISLKNANMKDSIPTKLYEAIGLGCPVILVAEGDACDILQETGHGRSVSPGNPELISDVFDSMIENYEAYDSNREHAKRLVKQNYSRQAIALEFREKIKSLIEEPKKGERCGD